MGDFETATDAYTRVLERYPEDYRALNNLALIYRGRHQFAIAESLFTRATKVDSTISNFYFGIHSTQALQGRFRESRATLELIARRFPENPIRLNVEIQDAAAQQNWEEAERQAETTIAAAQGDTLALIDPYEALASIVMTQGRLAEAERHWRTQLAVSAAAGSHGRHWWGLLQRAALEMRYRGETARAVAIIDSALAATPLDSVLPRGRPAEAILCTMCALPDLARAYEAAGKPDAAVVIYERYLSTPWLWRYEADASELGWAMKRLAEPYDVRGDAAKASAVRGRLLQLWRRADPELQPLIAQVRARLTG